MISKSNSGTPDEPRLRLYAGPEQRSEDAESSAAGEMTLSQFYDAVAPKYRPDINVKTIKQDHMALARWCEITGDPPLGKITMDTGDAFRKGLEKRKYLDGAIASNTVRKNLVTIQAILDLAGPTLKREEPRAELLDRTPYFARPKVVVPSPTTYTLSEIDCLLKATGQAYQAKNLRDLPAATYWQSLILFAYNTALRADTLLTIIWEMVDLDRQDWLMIPQGYLKRGSREEDFYINRYARQALDALKRKRPGVKPSDRIFDWAGWPDTNNGFYKNLRKVFSESELTPRRRKLRLHGLRRTTITWAIGENWIVSQIIAGHHTGHVTQEHYANRHRLVPPVLSRLPQPRPAGQKTLF